MLYKISACGQRILAAVVYNINLSSKIDVFWYISPVYLDIFFFNMYIRKMRYYYDILPVDLSSSSREARYAVVYIP